MRCLGEIRLFLDCLFLESPLLCWLVGKEMLLGWDVGAMFQQERHKFSESAEI